IGTISDLNTLRSLFQTNYRCRATDGIYVRRGSPLPRSCPVLLLARGLVLQVEGSRRFEHDMVHPSSSAVGDDSSRSPKSLCNRKFGKELSRDYLEAYAGAALVVRASW